jgi:hypothetical protein
MVFKFIVRFFKYLFSSLKKDASLQHKEEKIEKKEIGDILDEEVLEGQEGKAEGEIENENLQTLILSNELIPYLGSFISSVRLYLKTKEDKYIDGAQEKFHNISKPFKKIVGSWREIKKEVQEAVKILKKVIEKDSKMKEEVHKENKIMHQEYKNLTRSNKKGEDLDQDKKEAIIKNKIELLREQLALLNEHSEHSKQLLEFKEGMLENVEPLLKKAEKVENKIDEHQKKWKKFYRLLKKILSFLKREENYAKQFAASEEKQKEITLIGLAIDKKMYQLVKNKKTLDKEYDSFLIKEEIAQQKGDEELPEAA